MKANIIEHSSDELWCAARVTLSTELAAEKNQAKYSKLLESMIPPELSRRQGSARQRETEGGGGEGDVDDSRAHGVDTRSDTQKTSP